MIARSLNIKLGQEYIKYRTRLTNSTYFAIDITYNIKWDQQKNSIKFKVENSAIYLEKELNKYHLQHRILANKRIILDKFSLWLALDLWLSNMDKSHISFLEDLEIDKLVVNIR